MPLFLLISGYLFYVSINSHSENYILKDKTKSLLVPAIVWNLIRVICKVAFDVLKTSTIYAISGITIILLISCLLAIIIKKIKILNKVLFGGRK